MQNEQITDSQYTKVAPNAGNQDHPTPAEQRHQAATGMVNPKVENTCGGMLDGLYPEGDFRQANISAANLSGDFRNADFAGAKLRCCELSGNFDGARALGQAIGASDILPTASFKGADLCGAVGLFYSATQIQNAVVESEDRVDVRLGTTIQVRGKTYDLCLPAQVLKDIVVADQAAPHQADPTSMRLRRMNRAPESGAEVGTKMLYDLSGHVGDLVWESNPPVNTKIPGGPDPSPIFQMNAPRVIFRNIHRRPGQGYVRLVGNFDQASFKDCELIGLELSEGSFVDLDLSESVIEYMKLRMDHIEAGDLKFPRGLKGVTFDWSANKRSNSFTTGPGYALHVLAIWNSADQCDGLAKYVLNHVQTLTPAEAQKLRRSTAVTIRGVLKKGCPHNDDRALAAGLIARRNLL